MGNDDIAAAIVMLFFYVVLPLLFLGVTWLTHHCLVRARRKYLSEREAYYRERIPMTNLKRFPDGASASASLAALAVICSRQSHSLA